MKTEKIENEGICPIMVAVHKLTVDEHELYNLYSSKTVLDKAKGNIILSVETMEKCTAIEDKSNLVDITEYDRIIGNTYIQGWNVMNTLGEDIIGIAKLSHSSTMSIKRMRCIKAIENNLERLKELNE